MMTPLSIRGARRGFPPQHASSQIHVAGALAPPGCFRPQKESQLAITAGGPADRAMHLLGMQEIFNATAAARCGPAQRA